MNIAEFLLSYVARFGDGEWGPKAQAYLDEMRAEQVARQPQQETAPEAPVQEIETPPDAPAAVDGEKQPESGEEN